MKRHNEWKNTGKRLASYKEAGAARAQEIGRYEQLMAASTLTAARKLLWGGK